MWWSAVLLGLVSSLHCLGMCGPLQSAALGAFHTNVKSRHLGIYHGMRILTYGILGMAAGLLGAGLGIQNWQQETSLISGLLLLLAFIAFYLLRFDRKLLQILHPFLSVFRRKLNEKKSYRNIYFAGSGMLNGILPCGMVYLALLPAMGSGNIFNSFFYMLIFGAGTVPLLLLSNFGVLSFFQSKGKFIQRLIPAMVVITALLLILRGMDLGIPYLSPQMPVKQAGVELCK